MSSESRLVFHHREARQEASNDWGVYNDGHLQRWNHVSPNFTGVCGGGKRTTKKNSV